MDAHQKAVLELQAEARINAPADLVYNLLTDTSTWPTWNLMIPSVTIKSQTKQNNDSSSRHLQQGQVVHYHVQMPFFGKRRTVPGGTLEKITKEIVPTDVNAASNESYQIEWDQCRIPQFLLRTNRVNTVSPVIDDNAGRTGPSCVYKTYMTFNGPFAWFVKLLMKGKLQHEFDLWAARLKEAAESRV